MSHTIIVAQTDAVATQVSIQVSHVPATLFAVGLAGVEECDLYISPDAGATWEVLDHEGAPATLTVADSTVSIVSPVLLGVKKDATASAVGVYLADANKI